MGFETYLIEHVNQMHDLMIEADVHPEDENTNLVEAAVIGCETLKRLIGDKSFLRTVEQMSTARLDERGHTGREFLHIVDNMNNFEEFLKIEHKLLLESGLFPDIAATLISLSRNALDDVRDRAKPASEVIDAARTLTDQACETAHDLVEKAQRTNKWDTLKDRLKRIMMGIGGAAVIGVDAAAALPTAVTPVAPLTVAMGAVSAAFGASLVQNAAFPSEAQAASAAH